MYRFYRQNKMFYTDFVDNHIYSASLDTGDNLELLLNDNVEVPGNYNPKTLTQKLFIRIIESICCCND